MLFRLLAGKIIILFLSVLEQEVYYLKELLNKAK